MLINKLAIFQKPFVGDDGRSLKVKKNIVWSFIFKAIDAIVYFLVVPATLGYLDKYSYGIWLAINSILLWINTFDAGLGNGMRNCLTISLAKNDNERSRIYISTTYFLLFVIAAFAFTVFLVCCHFIDWYSLLKVDPVVVPNLNDVMRYSFLFVCLSFVFKLIGNVYMSLQLPSVNFFFMAAGHLLSLLLILGLRAVSSEGSLLWVGIVYTASPCLVYVIASAVTFGFLYRYLCPSLHLIKVRKYSKDLLNVGVGFFIIQITTLIIMSTSNVIISRLFGPDSVTPFNISNRYMAIVLMALNIVMAPIWSAVTDAWAKGDEAWVQRSVVKVRKISLFFGLVLFVMLAASPIVYSIWIGDAVEIPFSLTTLMCIYVFILIWSTGQSSFLNGLGILKLQLYVNVFEAVIFIPLAILFGKLWGINGMVMAMIVTNLPALITNTIQVSKITKHTAKGIWLR